MTDIQTATSRSAANQRAMNQPNTIQVAAIRKGDVQALALAGGFPLNALSPLNKLQKPSDPLTGEGRALGSQPAFASGVEILARPGWMVTFRMGGGDYPVQELCLCGQVPGGPVTGIRPASADMAEILQWASAKAFVAWWCGQHARQGEETVPNYLPPACTLEAFLMLLQAIDAYRRALMGSMLRHEAADNLKMTVDEFNATCRSGMQNRDTRWLAPAFVVLIPGFGEYRPAGGVESLKPSYDRGFLTTVMDASGKEQRIGFGEAGRAMGLEFARTWLMGAGLESRVCAPEGTRAIARCFVAPTGLTNHFVSLETGTDGFVNANHQPLTASGLATRLQSFLDQACTSASIPLAPLQTASQSMAPPPAPRQTTTQSRPAAASHPAAAFPPAAGSPFRFCKQCGAKLEAGAVFCANCGTRQ